MRRFWPCRQRNGSAGCLPCPWRLLLAAASLVIVSAGADPPGVAARHDAQEVYPRPPDGVFGITGRGWRLGRSLNPWGVEHAALRGSGAEDIVDARSDPSDAVASSHRLWSGEVTAAQIERRFPAVGHLRRIRIEDRTGHGDWGGRVKRLALEGVSASGKPTSIVISGDAFVSANPWPKSARGLRSSWFVISLFPAHTNITATVFWVGEPKGNGSSEDNAISAYDDAWKAHYGGYDDYSYRRTGAENYFPRAFTPKENPFYLDLPYDDLNVAANRKNRTHVIPWAIGLRDPGGSYSFMKNRWVRLETAGRVCYGQIEDAGPYVYDDADYVFGAADARPRSTRANNAGLDVSPALRDCLGFAELNGASDKVIWQFVDATDVPAGPWQIVVTTSQVYQP